MVTWETAKESKRTKWIHFLGFVGLSILDIYMLIWGDLKFQSWKDWLIVGGAILFSIGAVHSWRSISGDWTIVQDNRNFFRTLKWILASPFILGVVGVVIWGLFAFFSWLTTIPGWAAVIIVLLIVLLLLIILLLKKSKR